MIGLMAAQIRTSTFLDAVNHRATATTRLPESAQRNKFNPGKVGIAGGADLEYGLGTALFLVSLVVSLATLATATTGGVGSRDYETNTHPTAASRNQPSAFHKCRPSPPNRSR